MIFIKNGIYKQTGISVDNPVKITDSILEKLGFKFDSRTDSYDNGNTIIDIVDKMIYVSPSIGREIKCHMPEFVHELQLIIFAHTGELIEFNG